jgi:hypothetical protein
MLLAGLGSSYLPQLAVPIKATFFFPTDPALKNTGCGGVPAGVLF